METIYQGLYLPHRGALRRDLTKNLRTGRALRQSLRRKDKRSTRFIDPGRLIDGRHEDAGKRDVAGHWEGDLITSAYKRHGDRHACGESKRMHPTRPSTD